MSVHNVVKELESYNDLPYNDLALGLDAVTATLKGTVIAAVDVEDASAYTVLATNSGALHLMANQAQDITLTLPTAAAGLLYEFWPTMVAADGHDWVIDTSSDTNFFMGGLLWTDSAGSADPVLVAPDGDSNSILGIRLPSPGTWVSMYCDGTNWFLKGHVFAATTPDFADQS